jgi:hypothetical protein
MEMQWGGESILWVKTRDKFALAVLRSDWTGYDLYFDGEAIEVKSN